VSKVLVLGTSSGAGKTTFCAMLCNHLASKGVKVSPFKASNLSLNSYATKDGGEIGMGQAFQAWSCGVEPETDMNPILLKPCGNGNIQLIIDGRPHSDINKDSPMDTAMGMERAMDALGRLESRFDAIVCEGSGSPVELNLIEGDIANIGLMRETGLPTILVADIERGGCFAAIYGTWLLMPEDIRSQMKAFVINRFRGDASILAPAIDKVEELTGMKCIGIMPYIPLRFPEEDSLSSSEGKLTGEDATSAFKANIAELTGTVLENGLDVGYIEELLGL
jgi:adenosylcobyric acid synthase